MFPDEEISFFRIKGISIILIITYHNLIFNATTTVKSKMKHLYKYVYKTKIELKFKLKDRSYTFHAFMYFLIVTVISHACIFETK